MKLAMRIASSLVIFLSLLANGAVGENVTTASRPTATQPTSKPTGEPESAPASQPASAPAAKDEVSVSFKGMSVEQVASFLGEKLGKPVLISSDEVRKKKINILCKEKKPLKEALLLVRQALLDQGVMVEELDNLIRLRPVDDVTRAYVLRVPADVSVATIDDPLKIVAKEFLISHYDVKKMVEVVKPMLPSFAHVLADPDSRKMIITDTVANLVRIEQVIESMDVPMAERTRTEIIEVKHGDASEIIAIIRPLIAGRMGLHVKDITATKGQEKRSPSDKGATPPGSRGPRGGPKGGGSPPPAKKKSQAGVTAIEPSKAPVTLIPHVSRNWIIAVAPAEIMVQIKMWVAQLDKPREVEKDYELYDVKHAGVEDVSQRIQRTLQAMPSVEIRETTHVVPFSESKKLIVFGSKTGRELVRDLLGKLDVPDAEKRNKRTFVLKHSDAQEMAERIEKLFSAMQLDSKYDYSYGYSSTRYRRSPDVEDVTVVPDKRRNSITVITDAETMEEIALLIEQEDIPIDPSEIEPRVYELKYVDPGEIRDLLTEMFTEKESTGGSYYDFFFGGGSRKTPKPVGRLLGQFTFQVLPSSNRLIVNSKSVANYEVIDNLIAELDQPQRAGLPAFVELKHANAEDLCEQLNAMLAEPGTLARIRRAERGLAEYVPAGGGRSGDSNGSGSPSGGGSDASTREDTGEMAFWWQSFRPPQGRVPSSNLIGRIRIVPVYRRNAVMVLSPEAYKEPIQELMEELDQPARQVIIKARIGEIQHDDQTTLGLRIASDPSLLAPADSAIGGGVRAEYEDVFFGGTLVLGANANFNWLLNLLVREFGMKILLEPALTTADNEASQFFDGQDVSVATEVRRSSEGTSTVTGFEYTEVGTRLRVRPHITKNGNVDLLINLEISRIVPGSASQGSLNPTFDRREVTTHVVVNSGRTIMLSGIIRQDEFSEVHKVPLLGDMWLIGKLFRSIDEGVRNRELVIFITPHVMITPEEVDQQMAEPLETLKNVEDALAAGEQEQRPQPLEEIEPLEETEP